MKKALIVCLLITVVGAAQVFGQATVLLLTVKKKENTQTTNRSTYTDYYSGTYQSRSGVETVSYTIDLINAGVDVPNAKVSWTVVLRDPGSGGMRLVEGIRTTELKRGQKFSMETDIIELGTFSRDNYSTSRSTKAEVVGYVVEAIVDGKVVSSDARPMDIRNKVQAVRNAPKRVQ